MVIDQTRFPQYLRRPQASEYLLTIWGVSYSPATLAKLCSIGTGPETYYCGRAALHTPEDLDEFAKSRISGPTARKSHRSAPAPIEARP